MPLAANPTRRRRGFTMTEVMVSVAILAIVIGIIIPSTISYARTLKSIRQQQTMQKQVNLFMQKMDVETTRSQAITLISPTLVRLSGTDSQFVVDAGEATGYLYVVNVVTVELEFVDGDNKPETIEDNRIVMRTTVRSPANVVLSSREETVLPWVTPYKEGAAPAFVFRQVTGATRPSVEMLARIGDPIDPATDQTNKITGPGFQGFLVRLIISPTNLSSI